MSRNLCSTTCYFCGWRPTVVGQLHPITACEAGRYIDEYRGLIVADAECLACGAKYIAWLDERGRKPWRHMVWDRHAIDLDDYFDLSFRSSFDDEPDDSDLPTRPYGEAAAKEIDRLREELASIKGCK